MADDTKSREARELETSTDVFIAATEMADDIDLTVVVYRKKGGVITFISNVESDAMKIGMLRIVERYLEKRSLDEDEE